MPTDEERLAETDDVTALLKRVAALEQTVRDIQAGIERMAAYQGVMHVFTGPKIP